LKKDNFPSFVNLIAKFSQERKKILLNSDVKNLYMLYFSSISDSVNPEYSFVNQGNERERKLIKKKRIIKAAKWIKKSLFDNSLVRLAGDEIVDKMEMEDYDLVITYNTDFLILYLNSLARTNKRVLSEEFSFFRPLKRNI